MTLDVPLQPSLFHVLREQVAMVEMAGSLGSEGCSFPNLLLLSLQHGETSSSSAAQGKSYKSSKSSRQTSRLFAEHSLLPSILSTGRAAHRPHFLRLRLLDRRGHATRSRHVAMWRRPTPVFLYFTALAAGEMVALAMGDEPWTRCAFQQEYR